MKKNLKNESTEKTKLIKILVGTFFVGVLVTYLFVSYLNKDNTFEKGVSFSKERLAQNYPQFNVPKEKEIKSISGVVTSTEKDTLIVKINPVEPLATSDLDIRNVKIGANTNIFIAVFKGGSEYQKEIIAYQKAVKAGSNISKPNPYKNVEGNINDIGNNKVDISSDEDIRNQKSFTASEVIVHK